MKKIYCNCCRDEIDQFEPSQPQFFIQPFIDTKDGSHYCFSNAITLGTWKFVTDDIHFCRDCQLAALKAAVADLE